MILIDNDYDDGNDDDDDDDNDLQKINPSTSKEKSPRIFFSFIQFKNIFFHKRYKTIDLIGVFEIRKILPNNSTAPILPTIPCKIIYT